jgi:polyisoprenoid-binding protein YceI
MTLALLGLLGLLGVVAYSYLKPAPTASAPIETLTLETTAPVAASASLFEIVPAESEARFVIDEVLRGAPKTVVGATDQVAGQIALDLSDADETQVSAILINARTLATDSSQRDRAIQNRILNTAQHEYIVFTPTELLGLPGSISAGQAVPFQVVGDLTVSGVTREVTFDATIRPETDDRLVGSAITDLRYADFGLSIPEVPSVTDVSDIVRLEIDFVATAG